MASDGRGRAATILISTRDEKVRPAGEEKIIGITTAEKIIFHQEMRFLIRREPNPLVAMTARVKSKP